MDNSPKIPLCVDMDGTLLRVDSLHEQFAALFKKRPLSLLELFVWRLHGKAYLKKRISELSDTNISLLPIHKPFYAYLESQKKEGRKLLLVTGANERVAQAMIKTYPIFDDYLASSESHNLSGKNKANALIKRFGEKQFDYAGNSSCDLHVWKHCRKAIVVHACPSVKNKAKALCEIEVLFDKEKTPAKTYLRAMRIHHWVKNILIFIPMLLAHHTIADTLRTTGLAFLSFSFCASAVYILNDILDIASDRVHPTKQNRPIASGDISIKCGFFMILILLLLSAICAHFVAAGFIAILLFMPWQPQGTHSILKK